jgi:hypothetical protein
VQTQRAATLSDVNYSINELRDFGSQRGEFIDHNYEARRNVRVTSAFEFNDVFDLLLVEEVLAVSQFGPEGCKRPANQMRAEVGHKADGVGKVEAVGKGGTALVVDKKEGDALRRVRAR